MTIRKAIDKALAAFEKTKKFALPTKTYRNYEQGAREPKIELLKRFAQFFECTIDDLL